MNLQITICTDNAAFEDDANYEFYRILLRLAKHVGNGCQLESLDGKRILDTNGNTVGEVTIVKGTDQ